MSPRYAIYFTPERASPLARFAASWLGRDPWSDEPVTRPELDGIDPARLERVTASPRRYGFHATLVAPIRLVEDRDPSALEAAAVAFAHSRAPFTTPPLVLGSIGGFLAMVLSAPCPAMDALAGDCVRFFDAFRAPPTPAELERRRGSGLAPDREANLLRWGYPHVFECFRFHMTLTGRMAEPEHGLVKAALAPLVAPHRRPLRVDAITLFEQSEPDAAFRVRRRCPFDG